MGYLLSVPECIATAYYLSLCRPYELHDFIDALDWQNLSEDNFADLLRYSLPKMLGDPNAIDSMLTSPDDISQHRFRDIVNKLVCLCVIARCSRDPLRRNHAAQMLEEGITRIKVLYLRYVLHDIPGPDKQAYQLAYYRVGQGRSLTEFMDAENRKKVKYYIGDDGPTYSDLFPHDDSVIEDHYVCPVQLGDLVAPPPGRLHSIARVLLPGNPDADEIRRHRMYAIPAGHVYRHMPITSVKIRKNGTILPNPDGFPEIPSYEDSDEDGPPARAQQSARPGRQAARVQQRVNVHAGGEGNLICYDYESRKPPGFRHDTVLDRFNWNLPLTADMKRYHTFGCYWHQPMMEHQFSYVKNRSQHTELGKHMIATYGIYPPKHKMDGLSPKKKRINEQSIMGKAGLCVYDDFPTCVDECYEYGCMEGVPARTQNNLVCFLMNIFSLL